ncbi:response regulator [Dethiosulfatarculus sandiegensis]|uniref:Histidine kinase n=1 Tax=Dethiosulfatarculus sandiegensis TaxID=1429043 RepID=A0A0D2GDU1_9BACT|nr:response regulator [Dethiosulfatarculus sandiegensis]KIX13137.1 histidine kinase [Dethiosulfatarculus sandiegensis]
MSVVAIFTGSFCASEELAQGVASEMSCPILRDEDLIGWVLKNGGPSSEALRRAMFGRASIFNPFSHEKEQAISWLRMGLGELLKQTEMVYLGYGSLLMLGRIRHALGVCLIAETKYRVARATRELGLEEKAAISRVHTDDEAAFRWAEYLHNQEPWSPQLYDILLPMDNTPQEKAIATICEAIKTPDLQVTETSLKDLEDFKTAAQVEQALAKEGHNPKDAEVWSQNGVVTIRINKKVLMLNRLSEELKNLASSVAGVKEVKVEPGPDYYQADVYRRADFKLPSKVLLVDDEREFVETLSERLMLRAIGSAVVYNGKEALKLADEDEPEVMVLDLKMPGIDGMEVLRRIKQEHPEVEVIILTGHGSDRDRQECMEKGAFAYLEKPVDIETLSQTMQKAYESVKARRG